MSAYNQFMKDIEALQTQDAITEDNVLAMALRAVETYEQEPEKRQEIARSITGLWFNNENIQEGSLLDQICGEFADLELPDQHIDIKGFASTRDKWGKLAENVRQATKDSNP